MMFGATGILFFIFVIGFVNVGALECQPGEIKSDSCNHCYCQYGTFICTRGLCNVQDVQRYSKREVNPKFNPMLIRLKRDAPAIAAELKTTPCAPNDYLEIDCNTCYCNFDRTGYLCTEESCHDGRIEPPTTTHIPLTKGTLIIISDDGVQLLRPHNSTDNNSSPDQNPNARGIHVASRNDLQNDLINSSFKSPQYPSELQNHDGTAGGIADKLDVTASANNTTN